ncbi:MAG: hypothetical protein Ct9H90mP19_3800 [Gammaproteobacteria bacterium]|nr:MAG: hypothetical protein Ct9H90mP19_3800 [Gammaproteobacteria bacterium]
MISYPCLEVDEYDAWGIDTPEDLEKFRKHIEEIDPEAKILTNEMDYI